MLPIICDSCNEEMKETMMYQVVYMCPRCGVYLNKNEVLELIKMAESEYLSEIRIQ